MFTALQDSFRWTNDVVGEVVTGMHTPAAKAKTSKNYVWRPAVDIRSARSMCELTMFGYNG